MSDIYVEEVPRLKPIVSSEFQLVSIQIITSMLVATRMGGTSDETMTRSMLCSAIGSVKV